MFVLLEKLGRAGNLWWGHSTLTLLPDLKRLLFIEKLLLLQFHSTFKFMQVLALHHQLFPLLQVDRDFSLQEVIIAWRNVYI